MTNPACPSCNGWGFTNEIVGEPHLGQPKYDKPVMEFCTDVYPSNDRVPPELRGEPCTPRTTFVRHALPQTRGMIDDDRMRGGMRPASEKRLETRRANEAERAAAKAKENEPSRSHRR